MSRLEKFVSSASQRYPQYERERTQDGVTLRYIPWYNVVNILNRMLAHGIIDAWNYYIQDVDFGKTITVSNTQGESRKEIVLTRVRLEIVVGETVMSREGGGYEPTTYAGYGDPVSNATSMALRRAAAAFGIGLYLYDKGEDAPAERKEPRKEIRAPEGGSFSMKVPNDRISERSWNYMSKLLCERKMGEEDLEEIVITEQFDVESLEDLTQQQVSRIIDYLLQTKITGPKPGER